MANDDETTRTMVNATDGVAAVVYVKVAPEAFLFCHGPYGTVATFGGFCNKGEPALDAAIRELEKESCGAIKETCEGALKRMRYAFRKSIGPTYVFVLDYSDEPAGFVERARQSMLTRHKRLLEEDPVANKDWLRYDDMVVVTYDQIRVALDNWASYTITVKPETALPFRPVLRSMLAKLVEIECFQ